MGIASSSYGADEAGLICGFLCRADAHGFWIVVARVATITAIAGRPAFRGRRDGDS